MKALASLLVCLFLALPVRAEVTTTKKPGGYVQTNLGHGIIVNENSTLEREWIVVHDDRLPADLDGTFGVVTVYKEGGRYSRGEYQYNAHYWIVVDEPVAALRVNFILFDVWRDQTKCPNTMHP